MRVLHKDVRVAAALFVLGGALAACHDCLALPCALPMAMIINLTDGPGGAPVNDAVVQVSGASTSTVSCSATCYVPGTAGTYSLDVEAPGFQGTQRTVTVQGSNPACGCATATTEHLNIALVASP